MSKITEGLSMAWLLVTFFSPVWMVLFVLLEWLLCWPICP